MNAKMKVLSLALIGLCGYAGSALADCPTDPAQSGGGAWSSKTTLSGGTLAISPVGLDASACKLDATLGNSFVSTAIVEDISPTAEQQYRFQFLVNADATPSFAFTDSVQILTATAATSFPATGGRRELVTASLTAGTGGTKQITFVVSCNNAAAQYRCLLTTANLPAGANRVEGNLVVGATGVGKFDYWLNAPAGTVEPAATGTVAVDNAGWVGVDTADMGLASPSPTFKSAHAGQIVSFDTFDSRRHTYIGS